MVRDIPPGWVVATLGDIATPSPERVSPADVSPRTPYVGLEHIEAHTMQLLGRGSILGVRSSSVRFSAGDVLYARMRPYLNKVWVADFDGVCSAEFLVFRKHRAINSHFLAAVLNAEEFVDFANSRVSGERPRVKFSQLASFPIMLPPRVEQDLIVAKLHSVFARASRARKASNRALDRIKKYVTSVIDAGTAGDFTRDWRDTHDSSTSHSLAKMSSVVRAAHQSASEKERPRRTPATNIAQQSLHQGATSHGRSNLPKLPKGWLWISWTDLGHSQNGRPFPSSLYAKSGVKLLRPGNLYADGTVRWTEKNTRYLPETFERDNPDLIIEGNELVINLTAQSLHDEFLGRVCLTSSGERCLLNQRLARLTPAAGVRQFFLYVLKSSRFRRFVDGLNSGSLIQHIFTSQLGDFSLPFPPESEQIMIVEEIDRRLAAAERLRDTLVNQLARTREVRNAVLRDALAGRLVTSPPDAESAAKLLTDLHESVKLQPAKRGRTSMPKTKSSTKVTHPISLLATLKDHTDGMTPEQLFAAAGHTQDSIDRFFAELRELTAPPAAIVEERTTGGVTILRAAR